MRKIHLHLKGGRYDATNGVPTEALPALAAFGELVRSVAKDLFYHRNPDRERVTAGFDKAFVPTIVRIEGGGSADADFAAVRQSDNEDWQDIYDDAQDLAMGLLERAANDTLAFPSYLSMRSKRSFAEVLRLVSDDETLEATPLDDDRPAGEVARTARIDARIRQRVEAAVDAAQVLTGETFRIAGRVKGIQRDPWTLQVLYREGGRVLSVPVTDEVRDVAVRDLVDDVEALIWLSGTARRDEDGRRTFELASEIRRLPGPELGPRMAALLEVGDGWLPEEEGPSFGLTKRTARRVEETIWYLIEEVGCGRPYLFVVPEDGGVQAMWKLSSGRPSVMFSAASRKLEAFAFGAGKTVSQITAEDGPDESFLTWAREHLVES